MTRFNLFEGYLKFYLLTCYVICTLRYNDVKLQYVITDDSVSWLSSLANKLHGRSDYYATSRLIATRVEFWKDSIFLVTPKFDRKAVNDPVPFTVSGLHLRTNDVSSILLPFPSWTANNDPLNEKGITNAVDIFIDQREIMWILDSGRRRVEDRNGDDNDDDYNSTSTRLTGGHAKFLSYDLRSGKILRTISLRNITCTRSNVKNIFAEYTDDGQCYVYISDSAANGAIIVWSMSSDRIHRSVLPAAVKGCYERQVDHDELYTTLITGNRTRESLLYFTHLRSDRFFTVKTRHLREKIENGAIEVIGRKLRPCILLGSDKRSSPVLYLRELTDDKDNGRNVVYRWNVEQETLLETLELSRVLYVSDDSDYVCNQIVVNRSNGRLWALETDRRLHLNEDDNNIRRRNGSSVIAKLIRL